MSTIRLQDVTEIYAGPLAVDKAAASKRHIGDQVNRAFAERIEDHRAGGG